MSARSTSRLDAGLIARKGEAAPAGLPPDQSAARAEAPPAPRVSGKPAAVPDAGAGDKGPQVAVTVKLDPERYQRLRLHGVKVRRTNQAILQEALDAFLARHAD